jgi:hypothetical protein
MRQNERCANAIDDSTSTRMSSCRWYSNRATEPKSCGPEVLHIVSLEHPDPRRPWLVDSLRKRAEAVKSLLLEVEPLRNALAVQPAEYFMDMLDLVLRAAYVRQHEALTGHVQASLEGNGHTTVLALRPALEEYLWVKFLGSVEPGDGRQLLGSNILAARQCATSGFRLGSLKRC